ncbi:filament-like plant protein 3 [Rutidosis leptorrhynchoides]|uniref:filament-like plant protein 3 n=1 Tax=Rutidosis leptorrhynchoides TaxID=125765 RepID=UPI003A994D17
MPEKMDRRSWLWRRKSSEKSPGETESSGGSISSNSGRFLDDQVNSNQHSHSPEITSKADTQSEHNNGMMTLSEALMSINAKEELVKQHVKVAEEAVSGWEKAEREVLALRQQVEFLSSKNSTLEDRVIHLDGALKECLRQLRQTREEKDQFAHDALDKKLSETESSLTSTDTELYHKLEIVEKENTDLKLKLSSMTEELELRFIEKELSNRAAEQASKQYLDSVKKVAKFEAECRRLNSTLRKVNNSQQEARKTPYVTNGEFKDMHRFERNEMGPAVELDLMDDFLEMERLVGMPKRFEDDNKLEKVESLEIIVKDRENELKASRMLIEEIESKLDVRENELRESKERLKEVELKLVEVENELIVSRNRLEEAESNLVERENELNSSRSQLKEAELKLDMHEKEVKTYQYLLEESESKLAANEDELKETKSKLAKQENELKASRKQFEEAESKLDEQENELKLSRKQLQEAESKLKARENELKASRYILEEAESKLDETKKHLVIAESQCDKMEAELQILIPKVESLENVVQKERDLSVKAQATCRELENEVSKLKHELGAKSRNRDEEHRLLRVKQDTELAMAGSKFAECQKTIVSLNRQLQILATLDDFLIDTEDS